MQPMTGAERPGRESARARQAALGVRAVSRHDPRPASEN